MTWRVLLGKLPSGGQGLRVSKPGFDVFNATAEQLLFDSESPDWGQVIMVGAVDYDTNLASVSLAFPPGLTVAPYVFVGQSFNDSIWGPTFSEWWFWSNGLRVTVTSTQVSVYKASGTAPFGHAVVGFVVFANRGG